MKECDGSAAGGRVLASPKTARHSPAQPFRECNRLTPRLRAAIVALFVIGYSALPAASQTVEMSPEDLARQSLAQMKLEQRVGQAFKQGFVGTSMNASNRAM